MKDVMAAIIAEELNACLDRFCGVYGTCINNGSFAKLFISGMAIGVSLVEEIKETEGVTMLKLNEGLARSVLKRTVLSSDSTEDKIFGEFIESVALARSIFDDFEVMAKTIESLRGNNESN